MSDITLKKPEKIASAIYLLTSFFGDQEPLKWRLRGLSTELIDMTSKIVGSYGAGGLSVQKDINKNLNEMVSLFEIAKNAGLVSDSNRSIISAELNNYLGNFQLTELNSESFKVPEYKQISKPESLLTTSLEVGGEREDVKDKNIKDTQNIIPAGHLPEVKEEKKTKELKNYGAVSVKKNNRKSIIIGLLKRKREIMIKDVTPLIHGCSEKTIQRELLAMVHEGILKKEGEKRWSRYSLA